MTSEQRIQLWVAGIFLAAIALITIIATLVSSNASPNTSTFVATHTSPITSTDHVRGNATAKVSLIEYGDFQCPACGAYEPLVQQLYKEYGDKVAFVFRNFPLPMHGNAMIAAQAAEAAGSAGKYWEMHDLLYTHQREWSDTANTAIVTKNFNGYAQSLGINAEAFNTALNANATKSKIQNDTALGNTAQVDHTPTFFVNLTQIPNPGDYSTFKKDIDAALASSTASR